MRSTWMDMPGRHAHLYELSVNMHVLPRGKPHMLTHLPDQPPQSHTNVAAQSSLQALPPTHPELSLEDGLLGSEHREYAHDGAEQPLHHQEEQAALPVLHARQVVAHLQVDQTHHLGGQVEQVGSRWAAEETASLAVVRMWLQGWIPRACELCVDSAASYHCHGPHSTPLHCHLSPARTRPPPHAPTHPVLHERLPPAPPTSDKNTVCASLPRNTSGLRQAFSSARRASSGACSQKGATALSASLLMPAASAARRDVSERCSAAACEGAACERSAGGHVLGCLWVLQLEVRAIKQGVKHSSMIDVVQEESRRLLPSYRLRT